MAGVRAAMLGLVGPLRAAFSSSFSSSILSSFSSSCHGRLSLPSRAASPGARRLLSASAGARSEDKITIHFINRDGDKLTTKGEVGDTLLDVVVNNNLDIDGFGACEGTLACSTCHLIFENHIYEKLDAITDEENDMLDLAYGLTDTSRLGCQICLTRAMNNMTVRVPEVVADARQAVDLGKNS
ncbi:adrenodoxin, mitochondrial [Tachyglossus aculeatus]|uniref:adrenodoxin, mitochondrial n=1 Tax=Tachyglossus aculeatus TaxID=9261 RepID=UPI0018F7B7E9|nr:adrenodoxin, mitochondrial [Tachyglossus aculeatus]